MVTQVSVNLGALQAGISYVLWHFLLSTPAGTDEPIGLMQVTVLTTVLSTGKQAHTALVGVAVYTVSHTSENSYSAILTMRPCLQMSVVNCPSLHDLGSSV